jgi:hypothetical protein
MNDNEIADGRYDADDAVVVTAPAMVAACGRGGVVPGGKEADHPREVALRAHLGWQCILLGPSLGDGAGCDRGQCLEARKV